MKIECLDVETRYLFQPQIVNLEQFASYPWGDDFFKIDHGDDYFAFFDRLGEVDYYISLNEKQQVSAVGAGILRKVRDRVSDPSQLTWYLCDLKVHPQSQNQRLSLKLLRHAIAMGKARCDRGYSISMDPVPGQPSPWIRILEKFAILPFRYSCALNLYSLDAKTLTEILPSLEQIYGKIGYRSLQGKKDLRLQSSGQVLPLLHLEWGDALRDEDNLFWEARPGHIHLFCAPIGSPIGQEFIARSIVPSGTASVVSRGMEVCDWNFIMTSEI
jgi:GNAT superfamily N-acetyltransferase